MTENLLSLFTAEHKVHSIEAIRGQRFRLDAGFYASQATGLMDALASDPIPKRFISDLARVFGLSDFGLLRIPADLEYGVPFFTVSDIQEHEPTPTMFLSRTYEPNLSDYIVSKGDVLVSRSGSIGNVILVDGRLEGSAVSNHALRIVPNSPEASSLIYVVLSGQFGRTVLPSLSYGSVIDQIKSFQIESLVIPFPTPKGLSLIHDQISRAIEARTFAFKLLIEAQEEVLSYNSLPSISENSSSGASEVLNVEAKAISYSDIATNHGEYRLDAHFYNQMARAAIENIHNCPVPKLTLDKLSDRVFVSGRSKRNYVGVEYGTPFLSGRNIVQIRPTGLKYLANTDAEEVDEQLLKKSWVLVTRTGTVGRTCYVWCNFEDYAASDNILRIIPAEERIDPGYLSAFLSSLYGHVEITRFRCGSVVDMITDNQLKKVFVPLPGREEQKEIGDKVRLAYEKRAEAIRLEDEAQAILMREIDGHRSEES